MVRSSLVRTARAISDMMNRTAIKPPAMSNPCGARVRIAPAVNRNTRLVSPYQLRNVPKKDASRECFLLPSPSGRGAGGEGELFGKGNVPSPPTALPEGEGRRCQRWRAHVRLAEQNNTRTAVA